MTSADVLAVPAPRLGDGAVAALLTQEWGITATSVTHLPSERDLNRLVDGRYVLKVSNPAELVELVDLETQALAHARSVARDLPLPLTVASTSGASTVTTLDDIGRACVTRLLTVVPGSPAEGQPMTTELAEAIGAVCARMSLPCRASSTRPRRERWTGTYAAPPPCWPGSTRPCSS